MDTLVEELQQQLTRLPLQQRARCISAVYFVWYIVVIHTLAADLFVSFKVCQSCHEGHIRACREGDYWQAVPVC